MKKSILSLALVLTATLMACSQTPKSPRVTVEGKFVKVAYGQPSKKGRVIFGGLEKFGAVWRTGANEATEITFSKDGKFGGKDIKAGTYTLFTIPEEKEWTVILNGQLGQWGAFDYDKHKDKDVLKVKVPSEKLSQVVEKLTYTIDDTKLTISWDQTSISVPLSF